MNRILLFFSAVLLCCSCKKIDNPDDILGTYTNADQTRKIEIVKDGDCYTGVIVETLNEDDELGPGDIVLESLRGKYFSWKGNVIAKGGSYRCKIRMPKPDVLEIRSMGAVRKWTKL